MYTKSIIIAAALAALMGMTAPSLAKARHHRPVHHAIGVRYNYVPPPSIDDGHRRFDPVLNGGGNVGFNSMAG